MKFEVAGFDDLAAVKNLLDTLLIHHGDKVENGSVFNCPIVERHRGDEQWWQEKGDY